MMLQRVENYCTDLLTTSKCAYLPFHNIEHTKEVVSQVETIGAYQNLSKMEIENILIAAWFHDTGHLKTYKGHEDASKQIAKTFLEENNFPTERMQIVQSCIEATKMPQRPANIYSEILCDADVYHIGTSDFFFKKLLLRREWCLFNIMTVEDIEWHKLNKKFLHEHHFHSKYGKEVLEKGKNENEKKVDYILGFCD